MIENETGESFASAVKQTLMAPAPEPTFAETCNINISTINISDGTDQSQTYLQALDFLHAQLHH